jgi:soluble lytic murein transglycosylase-like protein
MSLLRLSLPLLLLACLLPADVQAGGIYKFIDRDGVTHFSDMPYDARYELVKLAPRDSAIAPPPRVPAPVQHDFDMLILRMARVHELEPALVKAVIAAESNFDVAAISRVGAQGLMQLMPATADAMGVAAPFEARDNVKGGARYLRNMLDRYGDVRRALAAYNAGPNAVDLHQGIPPYPETQAYVERVLNYYRAYQGQFPHF